MNTTPTHFLCFDTLENEWKQTTLEELTMRNDPDLYIVPVYENDKQGKQCTWKEYENADRKKQWAAPSRPTAPHTTPQAARTPVQHQAARQAAPANAHDNLGLLKAINSLKSTIAPTCDLVNFTCRFFLVVFGINCICAGLVTGIFYFGYTIVGVLVGLLVGVLFIFLVKMIVSVWGSAKEE